LLIVATWDTEEDVRAVLGAKSELPVPMDLGEQISGAYGVEGVPTAVFIDAEGSIGEVRVGGMIASEIEAAVGALD
jgi:hypothetical protein